MRTWTKPEGQIEVFEPMTAVADCTRKLDKNVTTYEPQTIKCEIVSGDDSIFVSGCDHNVDRNGSDGYYFTTYNGKNYFVWYDGIVSKNPPSADGEALMEALGINGPGWHAGQYDSTVTQYFTLS